MAISESRAIELAHIEPPDSMKRIILFLDSLSLAGTEGTLPTLGFDFSKFSAGIAGKSFESLFSLDHDPTHKLLRRFNVSRYELRDFALWLIKWDEKRSEVEVLTEAQAISLGSLPPSGLDPSELYVRRAPGTSSEPGDYADSGIAAAGQSRGTIGDIARGRADSSPDRNEGSVSTPLTSVRGFSQEAQQPGLFEDQPTRSSGFSPMFAGAGAGLGAMSLGILMNQPSMAFMSQGDASPAFADSFGAGPSFGSRGFTSPDFSSSGGFYPPDVSITSQPYFPGAASSPNPGGDVEWYHAFNGGTAPDSQPVFFVPPSATSSMNDSAGSPFYDQSTAPQQWFPTPYSSPSQSYQESSLGGDIPSVFRPDSSDSSGSVPYMLPPGYGGQFSPPDPSSFSNNAGYPGGTAASAIAFAETAPFLLNMGAASSQQAQVYASQPQSPEATAQAIAEAESTGGVASNSAYPVYSIGGPLYAQRAAAYALLPSMDMDMGSGSDLLPSTAVGREPDQAEVITPTAQHGQLTLVAPPLMVASAEAEASGAAMSFPWATLIQGAGTLDAGGLQRLQAVLPAGAKAIYPALPEGSLGPSAVNLNLESNLLGSLLSRGYGSSIAQMAPQFAAAASAESSSPSAAPLQGSIVPGKSPTQAASILPGGNDGATGSLASAGAGQAQRGGALDFLGLPVRLAPSLSGRSELNQEVAVRSAIDNPVGSPMRPNDFGPLRQKLFPSFQSVTAEPDKQAWSKAAPSFGLRDDSPTTLLSPDSRITPPSPSGSQPQAATWKAPPTIGLMGNLLGGAPTVLGGAATGLPSAFGTNLATQRGPGMLQSGLVPTSQPGTPASPGTISHPGRPSLPGMTDMTSSGAPGFHSPTSTPASAFHTESHSPSAPMGFPPMSHFGLPSFVGSQPTGPLGSFAQGTTGAPHSPPPSPGGLGPVSQGSSPRKVGSLPTPAGSSVGPFGGPAPSFGDHLNFGGADSASHPESAHLHLPSIPSMPMGLASPMSAPSMRTSSIASVAPERLFSASQAGPRTSTSSTMAIQKSDVGSRSHSASQGQGAKAEAKKPAKPKSEQTSGDTEVLAHEVWALLKRRLSVEADRQGRW